MKNSGAKTEQQRDVFIDSRACLGCVLSAARHRAAVTSCITEFTQMFVCQEVRIMVCEAQSEKLGSA